jgi:hypothetical protein
MEYAARGQRKVKHRGSGPGTRTGNRSRNGPQTEAPLSSLAKCGSAVEALDRQQIETLRSPRVKRRTTGHTDKSAGHDAPHSSRHIR